MQIFVTEKKFLHSLGLHSSQDFLRHSYHLATGEPLPPLATMAQGKPYFPQPQHAPYAHFNLSHSGNYLAVAFHSKPLGLDLQVPRRPSPALVQRVCSLEEQQWLQLRETQGQDMARDFARLWTAKEAYCKCTGEGIGSGRGLAHLPLPLPPEEDPSLQYIVKHSPPPQEPGFALARWEQEDFFLGILAICRKAEMQEIQVPLEFLSKI